MFVETCCVRKGCRVGVKKAIEATAKMLPRTVILCVREIVLFNEFQHA